MAVTLHTTHGEIKVEVFCERTPIAAKNFLGLCARGDYDGTIFHRNIRGFIVQGGDCTHTGRGGKSIYGKPFQDEIHADIKSDKRGMISMASTGPNTNLS